MPDSITKLSQGVLTLNNTKIISSSNKNALELQSNDGLGVIAAESILSPSINISDATTTSFKYPEGTLSNITPGMYITYGTKAPVEVLTNENNTITLASSLEGLTNGPVVFKLCSYANSKYSISTGSCAVASGVNSIASNNATVAKGNYSHAEGVRSKAIGNGAHAEGSETIANGTFSHAEGIGTISNGPAQHVFGRYNTPDDASVEIVGAGSASERKNIRTLDENGNMWVRGAIKVGGTSSTDAKPVLLEGDITNITDYESIVNNWTKA